MSATAHDLEGLRRYGDSIGEALASTGQQFALSVDPDWNDAAWDVLVELARTHEEFTADDVAAAVGPAPSPGASGALFRAASQAELIDCVGYGISRRLTRTAGSSRRWQGIEP